MANSGITYLGYQDPLREYMKVPVNGIPHIFRSGLYRQPNYLQYYDMSKLPRMFHDVRQDCKQKDNVFLTSQHELEHRKRNHKVSLGTCWL